MRGGVCEHVQLRMFSRLRGEHNGTGIAKTDVASPFHVNALHIDHFGLSRDIVTPLMTTIRRVIDGHRL
jgi:hypothetical protein